MQRRQFLQVATTAALTATAPFAAATLGATVTGRQVFFYEGVASGDPTPDSVILWTRAESQDRKPCQVLLQVSEHRDFHTLVLEEQLTASADEDFTLRARVGGLQPGRHYFYRFSVGTDNQSRIGRTMTALAADDPTTVKLAFASCQNYEQGFYGAWARMLEEDRNGPPDGQIHFVLHLGDFIYERYRHRASEGLTFVRRLPPFPDGARKDGKEWAVSLADYRHLYKTHLRDPHLQAARARWPFVCTWDDHEFSNDSFQHFSTYDGEILAEPRRQADAHQAWFEYIPAAVTREGRRLEIYRQLRWGQSVDLLLTDLRSYRTASPLPPDLSAKLGQPMEPVELINILDAGRDYNGGEPPETLPFGDGTIPNPAREREPGTLLGVEQKDWFKQQLQESDAPWKVWGNSLPLLPLRLDLSTLPLQDMHDGILSEDAWAGYPGEYRELMAFLREEQVGGLVSLSGDHHMHGAATLAENPDIEDSPAVAADFNVTGISSTTHFRGVLDHARNKQPAFMQLVAEDGDDGLQPVWNMTLTRGVLASMAYAQTGWKALSEWLGPNSANPGLVYVDSDAHGYGIASFSPDVCQVSLVTVEDASRPLDPQGPPSIHHSAEFKLPLWNPDESPQLDGPHFQGSAPFPFKYS